MKMYQTIHVFTPTTRAQLSFVERDSINDRLVDALTTPGKQIVVYGHSGSGKTTLLLNKLEQLYEGEIITRCVAGLTFGQLVADAFDQLAPVYVSSTESTEQRTVGMELKAQYKLIESKLSALRTESTRTVRSFILPPQLTAPTLARFLGEAKMCWVLEDFHKIERAEKVKLAQMMKVFMDMAADYPSVRIVAIGAVGTARQVVEYDPEMRNRVAEIEVPLMTRQELGEIIAKGESLLNIEIPATIRHSIVNYSGGLAAICHQFCLYICQETDILETLPAREEISEDSLEAAVRRYMADASDTLRATFDKALRRHRTSKFDNPKLIIKALLNSSGDGATHNELLRLIQNDEPTYRSGSLNHTLKKLQNSERGGVVRYDESSGRYSFSDPLYRVYARLLFKQSRADVSDLRVSIGELSQSVLQQMQDALKGRDGQ